MKSVLVIGDVIVDEYTSGRAIGISAETPTIVARQESTKVFVGGAGLVVRHLLRLGAAVTLVTARGHDGPSVVTTMKDSFDSPTEEEFGRLRLYELPVRDWVTPRKRRFFVDGYKLAQFDVLGENVLPRTSRDEMLQWLRILSAHADVAVVCDNRHGLLSGSEGLIAKLEVPLYVDSQVSQSSSNIDLYRGASHFFMNERELLSFLESIDSSEMSLEDAHRALGGTIVLKRGAFGSVKIGPGSNDGPIFCPSFPIPGGRVVDTCGAGDAFLAQYVMTCDAVAANEWAARTCAVEGTVVPKFG